MSNWSNAKINLKFQIPFFSIFLITFLCIWILIAKDTIIEDKSDIYDLEQRTAIFGEEIIKFCKNIPPGNITNPLIQQLVRCGTSVGANYCEADDAISKKDFKFKIGIVKKETRETKFFIRMIVTAVPELKDVSKKLLNESKELNLIFNAIFQKLNKTTSKWEAFFVHWVLWIVY